MRQYEVIVTGRFSEFFNAKDKEAAISEMLKHTVPSHFSIEDIEVIDLESE